MALRSSCVAVFILLIASRLIAQVISPAQLVDKHLIGTWSGVSHDYTVTPFATHQITITVVADPKKRGLDMDYFYVDEGKHYPRLVVFEPSRGTVFIDRKEFGKERQRADGLNEFLRTGYGDLTLWARVLFQGDHHAEEKAEYHLSPDSWHYELYVSAHKGPFVKTGDWTMMRVSSTP